MLEKIETVFSIFHDGTIAKSAQDQTGILLEIECQYLAELLNPNFLKFYVKLNNISNFHIEIWREPPNVESVQNLLNGRLGELEILSADIESDCVRITCQQLDSTLNYPGANLYVSANEISVFNHQKVEITLEELIRISKQYWSKFK